MKNYQIRGDKNTFLSYKLPIGSFTASQLIWAVEFFYELSKDDKDNTRSNFPFYTSRGKQCKSEIWIDFKEN